MREPDLEPVSGASGAKRDWRRIATRSAGVALEYPTRRAAPNHLIERGADFGFFQQRKPAKRLERIVAAQVDADPANLFPVERYSLLGVAQQAKQLRPLQGLQVDGRSPLRFFQLTQIAEGLSSQKPLVHWIDHMTGYKRQHGGFTSLCARTIPS